MTTIPKPHDLGARFEKLTTDELNAEKNRLVSEYKTQRDWAFDGCTSSATGAYYAAQQIDAINAELKTREHYENPINYRK